MGLFGPSQGEVWQQLSQMIGATYTPGGFFQSGRVDARVGEWIVTLDTFTESSGHSSTTYTRLRAPFLNPSSLLFSIHRTDIFTGIGKALGMQDIVTGDPAFDAAFAISGNNESYVTALFQDAKIRELLGYEPSVHFEIRHDEGWFGPNFPPGTDELYFRTYGTIRDIGHLQSLFNLFAEVLHRLTEIGAATEGGTGVRI